MLVVMSVEKKPSFRLSKQYRRAIYKLSSTDVRREIIQTDWMHWNEFLISAINCSSLTDKYEVWVYLLIYKNLKSQRFKLAHFPNIDLQNKRNLKGNSKTFRFLFLVYVYR